MKILKYSFPLLFLIVSFSLISQTNNHRGFDCFVDDSKAISTSWDPNYLGGQMKPESIERYTNNPIAFFPVLVVYVQFANDPGPDWTECVWHKGQPPNFFGTVIATQKATNFGSDWWNAYNENSETLSDYWMEVSKGKQHIVGQEINVVLPHEVSWYEQNGNLQQSMEDLFTALQNNPNINWPRFDKWGKDLNGVWQYGAGDGYVDMMYIVARSNPCSVHAPGWGYFRPVTPHEGCTHAGGHTVYQNGSQEIKVFSVLSEQGSGFQISPGGCGNGVFYAPMDKWAVVSFTGHEHGHYLFFYRDDTWLGGHQNYGKVNNYNGVEEFYSPYELIRMGFFETQKVIYSSTSDYPINDWTSRDNEEVSQILEVPIGDANRNEFFLIANRQKVSKYDKIMWGDTAQGNPYRIINPDYGKGIYIYHAYPGAIGVGYQWQVPIDQECADGLYDWVQDGYQQPNWDPAQNIPYFIKNGVVYNYNDNGGSPNSNLTNHDGKSVPHPNLVWFGIGQKHTSLFGDGTDRYWTNRVENFCFSETPYQVWTSLEWQGDRWDGWQVGYNEVFSPYSSPSTANWSDQQTGIFIYLAGQNGTTADLKIYKVGEGYTEDQILQATPPSKPMGVELDYYYPTSGPEDGLAYPRIRWNHNMEPDMVNSKGKKKYVIYRALENDLTKVPLNYTEIATVSILPTETPEYIDNSVFGECSWLPDYGIHVKYPLRYRVQAVDAHTTSSVLSDFVAAVGIRIDPIGGGGEDLDRPGEENSIPEKFSIYNYPNPFNPSTQIKFSIPQNTFVTLKIYNAIGQEVATLINNEYKNAGWYNVDFNGSNLASGIYFYSIEAGSFRDVKKMVLIK